MNTCQHCGALKYDPGEIFITSDLSLATVLSLRAYPIKQVDRSDPKRVKFSFLIDKELEKIVKDYESFELAVEPQALFNQMKTMKSRIYDYEY